MGRVLLAAGLTSAFLITQGIGILRTQNVGGLGAYIAKPRQNRLKPGAGMVLFSATLHIIPGIGVLALLVFVALLHHVTLSGIEHCLWVDWQGFLFAFLFLGGGAYALIQPSKAVGWAKSAHPDLREDNPAALLIVKVVGVVLCLMGLVMLFAIVS